jgi:hypothetical protein
MFPMFTEILESIDPFNRPVILQDARPEPATGSGARSGACSTRISTTTPSSAITTIAVTMTSGRESGEKKFCGNFFCGISIEMYRIFYNIERGFSNIILTRIFHIILSIFIGLF